jgi:hypothetical protein
LKTQHLVESVVERGERISHLVAHGFWMTDCSIIGLAGRLPKSRIDAGRNMDARNGRVEHLHQVSRFAQRREASENTANTPARLKRQNCFLDVRAALPTLLP